MAFKSIGYLKTMASRMGANRTMATSTIPKMKPYAPTLDAQLHHTKPGPIKGESVPVFVAMGSIMLAFSFVFVTAKQHLAYSPAVHVSKKKRGSLPELSDPDSAVDGSDKFIKRSLFRKVAHASNNNPTIPNPIGGDIYTRPVQAETLKSVGVNPSTHI
ncbi:Nfu1 iron-sulfur cluster protein [Thalictrum thalictroides]|uniref:Nfu1 iron-sulfur cluster protein n=1 Tax=Thalictrum thalictroides TaxID=46969 RepID=A0A7J6X001_THATH|nr:Nfu1 iron-sulfur cluster protein [Thalictrum thalictroides]